MHQTLSDELQKYTFIVFAICFGSQVRNKSTPFSDIDIAIYLKNSDTDLDNIGQVIALLERRFSRKIDMVILNELFKKNPFLSFKIISEGKLLFCSDENALISFKRNTFLYYIDVKPLLDKINHNFRDRLNSGNFGGRNYARTT